MLAGEHGDMATIGMGITMDTIMATVMVWE